jgi:lysyl-tRNA synthetase class I
MDQYKRIKQIEYLRRVDVMTALLAKSIPYSHMIRLACQQWGISERQAKRYIQTAREKVKEVGSQSLADHYHQVISWYISIYQDATQSQDNDMRRKAARDMVALLRQVKRDLSHEEFKKSESRLIESGEMEEILQALANEERLFQIE